MKPNNPFLISGYYSPEYFCDREAESGKIIDALRNGRNVTLISPRRMGKTGLIKHVFHQIEEKSQDVGTLYMDIYSTQNLGDFVKMFASTVLGQLDSTPQKAMKRISQIIRSCRPVISFDDLTGIPKVMLDVVPTAEEPALKEIFDYLQSSEKRCYIAIDEFQQIREYPEKGVEALLRSYMQFLPNVNFIFAGSKQHIMQDIFISAKKPFYQSTQMMALGCIDADMYHSFAEHHFMSAARELPRDIFDFIYESYDGHTWYIQSILNRLYGYPIPATETLVQFAETEIISENSYLYENLLSAYPAGSIRLLKAVAQEGKVKEILSGDFISKYKLRAASSVSSAAKRLVDNEMLYKTPDGYIIYDRFFGEWLRRG